MNHAESSRGDTLGTEWHLNAAFHRRFSSALPPQPDHHLPRYAGRNRMSLATPWPLKLILDNVVGDHKMSPWLHNLLRPVLEGVPACTSRSSPRCSMSPSPPSAPSPPISTTTSRESVGQYVAHDLRMRMYTHMQRLSLGYYNTHQTGTLISTLTTDIQTIQASPPPPPSTSWSTCSPSSACSA